MKLQVLQDSYGNNTGVYVPMSDWQTITDKYQDLKTLVEFEKPKLKKTMKDFLGCISNDTAKAMHEELAKTRNEWEERLEKQF